MIVSLAGPGRFCVAVLWLLNRRHRRTPRAPAIRRRPVRAPRTCAARVVMSFVSSIVGAVVRVVPGPGHRRRRGTVGAAPGDERGAEHAALPGHRPAGTAVVEDRQHLLGHLVQRLAQAGQVEGLRRGRCRRSRRCRSRAPAPARARAAPSRRPSRACRRRRRPRRRVRSRRSRVPTAAAARSTSCGELACQSGCAPPASAGPRTSHPLAPLVAHGGPRRPAEEADPVVAGLERGAGPPWPRRRGRRRRPTR